MKLNSENFTLVRGTYPAFGIFIFLTCLSSGAYANDQRTISGRIIDSQSGENLAGANIWQPVIKAGTTTNSFGYFSFRLPLGSNPIEISFIGYKKKSILLFLHCDTTIHWQLEPGIDLDEIKIIVEENRLEQPLVVVKPLDINTIKKIPSMLGETDVIKILQILPGVKSGNEGTSGIQVRGGSNDQNLILLDGVPVYNSNHLFGYLSTFNSYTLKDLKFYKGGIPARYGGRLSSIVDIQMKEGNKKKLSGNISVSPVAGSILIEGPFKTDTSSYLLSFRRTWLDIPFRIYKAIQSGKNNLGYSFYDLNAKANLILRNHDRVYFSHYQGKDKFLSYQKNDDKSCSLFSFQWENFTSLFRWNKILSSSLFVNTSFYHSLYKFRQDNENNIVEKYKETVVSGLNEFSFKSDFESALRNFSYKFGYQVSFHSYKPEITTIKNNLTDTVYNSTELNRPFSLAVYAESDMTPFPKVLINAGIRSSLFRTGAKNYLSVEPRMAFSYFLTSGSTIKASVQKMFQPLHLLTNTALNMPTDLWVPATARISPSVAWQYDLEYGQNLFENFCFSLDLYYKPIKNIIQYKQGISFLKAYSKTWQDLVDVGNGLNFGAEIMIEKTTGKFQGWVNYTLAWAWLKFKNINNNSFFPFKYDRRHDINILLNYDIRKNKKGSRYFTVLYKYSTGNAITIPVEVSEGITAPGTIFPGENNFYPFSNPEYFPYPNNFRMPPFHHLDLSYSISSKLGNNKERVWKYSIYNIYNRLNPYYYVKRNDKVYQVSMLPIIPSISFIYKW